MRKRCKKKLSRLLWTFVCIAICSPAAYAELLRFKYRRGDRYRILTTLNQDLYVDGVFDYSSESLSRIQVHVVDAQPTRGFSEYNYQFSEELRSGSGNAYQVGQDYHAQFWQDELGVYDIDAGYFVPTVREVPILPANEVAPGDRWTADGYQVHDFREGFGVEDVYRFSMPVSYEYRGKIDRNGMELDHIRVEYNVYHREEIPLDNDQYPYLIEGFSRQNFYFDNLLGRTHSVDEEFEFLVELSNGMSLLFRGSAMGEVVEGVELDREALKAELEEQLNELGVEDSSVIEDHRGITIALENIQFFPDSSQFFPEETGKLEKIAGILARYPDRDILVSGHTALAGTAAGRQQLSQERARVVVEHLLDLGARDPEHIMYQGFGARQPLGDNNTEAGRRRNRRVEITILEN